MVEINRDGAQGSANRNKSQSGRSDLGMEAPAAPDINALVTGLQGGLVGERVAAQLSPKPIVQCSVSLIFNK